MLMPPPVITAEQAAKLVANSDTLLIGGSGAGHSVPDTLIAAVGRRFQMEGEPRNLTTVHPVGLGDRAKRGIGHLAHPGLLKRVVCGTLVDSPPVERMAAANEIEAYTLPQGCLSQLTREMAAGRPGLTTHVGLGTFVDPRYGGGKQSARAQENLVELINVNGKEYLFFKSFHVDIALVRGTTADEDGNITMEHEAVFGEMISMAQAARRCGGIVIAQVKRMALRGTLPPKQVKIPGMLVDLIVVDPAADANVLHRARSRLCRRDQGAARQHRGAALFGPQGGGAACRARIVQRRDLQSRLRHLDRNCFHGRRGTCHRRASCSPTSRD